MRRYIGLDVHKASTTFGVINESGKRVGVHVVETNGEALVAQLKAIPGERYVCLEEGTQSAWLYEILSPHAKQVAVEAVSESRGQKDDERDALGLAERMRTGAIKRTVYKDTSSAYRQLRELGRTHTMVVRDVVRVQNRIKALFRSRGVSVSGKGIYSEEGRKAPLERLPEASRGAAETLFAEYDAVAKVRRHAEKDLVAEAHRHDVSRLLETCPGLGPIRVAQLIPIVVSPGRFRTKRQFWSYCGLGIVMRSSSDWVKNETGDWQREKVQKTRGLNLTHNSTLKNIFKGAAKTVVVNTHDETEPLYQDYQRLLAAGTKPNLARLTIARKVAAIALSMWKSGGRYDATKHRKPKE